MKKIGLLTIGQSPRVDMTPEMLPHLGERVSFAEAGALDQLTASEIETLAPEEGEPTYVSRLRNGESAILSKQKLLPYLQAELAKLEPHVNSSIIVCTGSFPDLMHEKPLLFPDKMLNHVVRATIGEGMLGSIIPLEAQKEQLARKWHDIPVCTAAASPYEGSDVEGAARFLKAKGATMLVLDCMGYTNNHKQRTQKAVDLPVVLARSTVARIAAELV